MSDKTLIHYGTQYHSGRYPWGSGETPYQRNADWITYVKDMRGKGLTDTEIARGMGMKTTEFRNRNSLINAAVEQKFNLFNNLVDINGCGDVFFLSGKG